MQVEKFDVFGVNVNIFICVTDCMSEEDLRINWRKIRNESAETYQLDNIDDFERWNFYLFYVVNDKRELNRSLKYEIEHDTISSRKVIVSANEYKEKDIKNLISSYIKYDMIDLYGLRQEHVYRKVWIELWISKKKHYRFTKNGTEKSQQHRNVR